MWGIIHPSIDKGSSRSDRLLKLIKAPVRLRYESSRELYGLLFACSLECLSAWVMVSLDITSEYRA